MAKSKQRKHVIIGGRRFDEVILTEAQAIAYGHKWKDFLGLKDWILDLHIKREPDMEMRASQGEVWARTNKKILHVNLLHPEDYPDKLIPQNMERTILHELKHATLYPFKLKDKLYVEEEQYVESQAHALYELSQGRTP